MFTTVSNSPVIGLRDVVLWILYVTFTTVILLQRLRDVVLWILCVKFTTVTPLQRLRNVVLWIIHEHS